MSAHTGTINQVEQALIELGEATALEVADYLDITIDQADGALARLISQTPRTTKRAYIKSWRQIKTKTALRLVRVYSVGNRRDKPKPKPMNRTEIARRYRDRLKIRTTNSVFALGLGIEQRKAMVRVCAG